MLEPQEMAKTHKMEKGGDRKCTFTNSIWKWGPLWECTFIKSIWTGGGKCILSNGWRAGGVEMHFDPISLDRGRERGQKYTLAQSIWGGGGVKECTFTESN